MTTMKPENSATLFYILLGVILGYTSFLLKNNFMAAGLAVVGFFVGAFVLENLLEEKRGYKWYFTNAGWIYFFVWFIFWVIFYNL